MKKSSAIILVVLHGEIAQLARAFGSYPKGRGFDPLSRYQIDTKLEFSSENRKTTF